MGLKGGCNDPRCKASSGICGAITFGKGELDDYGYWDEPCDLCARAWEKLRPGEFAWPRKRILWFDNREYWAEVFHHQWVDGIYLPLFPKEGSVPTAMGMEGAFSHPFWLDGKAHLEKS